LDKERPFLPVIPLARIKIAPRAWIEIHTLSFDIIRNGERFVVLSIIHLALHLGFFSTSTPSPFGVGPST
jgi:hypothetical protein